MTPWKNNHVNRRYKNVLGAGGIFWFYRNKILDFGLVAYDSMQLVHTQVASTFKKEAVCSSEMSISTYQPSRLPSGTEYGMVQEDLDKPVRLNGASTDGSGSGATWCCRWKSC